MEGKSGNNSSERHQKMKVLCLHGFRTSGSFLRKQISKWDASIFQGFEMVFPDGLFPAGGKSDIEDIFPPPYFEWFQFNKEFTEYINLEECITFLCDYMIKNGPFDGLLGFSQGATLSALLVGYQAQGKVLKDHPPIKLMVSVSGSKFRDPIICDAAYKEPIKVQSLHFIGEKDWLKLPSEELAAAFYNPVIIRHPQGHTVPRLDEAAVKAFSKWTNDIVQGMERSDTQVEGSPEIASDLKKTDDAAPEIASDLKKTDAAAEETILNLNNIPAGGGCCEFNEGMISPKLLPGYTKQK